MINNLNQKHLMFCGELRVVFFEFLQMYGLLFGVNFLLNYFDIFKVSIFISKLFKVG